MSAQDLGQKLVGEVRVERLDELLTTLDLLHEPTRKLGIRPLDTLVSIFTPLPNLATGVPPPPILELSSPTPSTGPLHLLYLVTATSILPEVHGGKASCICVVDASSTFDTSSLTRTLRHRIQLHDPQLPEAGVASAVTEALRHVHVFAAETLDQTIAALLSLPGRLSAAGNPSRRRCVAAVLLPLPSLFLWPDRAAADAGAPSRFPALAAAVRVCAAALRTRVVYAAWQVGKVSQPWTLPPQLPGPFATLPVLRLVVRARRRKFAADVGADEVLALAKGGPSGDGRSVFDVRVNGFGAVEWGDRIRGALGREGDGFSIGVQGGVVELLE